MKKLYLTLFLTSAMFVACNSGGTSSTKGAHNRASVANQVVGTPPVVANIAVLNNPSIQDAKDIGLYQVSATGKAFFNSVVLFAANINGDNPNSAVLTYNSQMNSLLNTKTGLEAIRGLQAKGIKVQIAYLGNHDNAGWSCNMAPSVANNLAKSMVDAVNHYALDGIMIDDEYSKCYGNTHAFFNLVRAIKTSPDFNGKILTKALYQDGAYFNGSTNIARYLDQGYEMTYAGDVDKLSNYVASGIPKTNLELGISPEFNSAGSVFSLTKSIMDCGYAGVMIWAPNVFFKTTKDASNYFGNIADAEYGTNDGSYIGWGVSSAIAKSPIEVQYIHDGI